VLSSSASGVLEALAIDALYCGDENETERPFFDLDVLMVKLGRFPILSDPRVPDSAERSLLKLDFFAIIRDAIGTAKRPSSESSSESTCAACFGAFLKSMLDSVKSRFGP
jgi:hypothetical protein